MLWSPTKTLVLVPMLLLLPTITASSQATNPKLDQGEFKQSIKLLEKIFSDDTRRRLHGSYGRRGRDLQDSVDELNLPPPFTPERDCNAAFGTLTAEEVSMLADAYLLALFQPGSQNEGLADLARSTLLSRATYDVTLAKVCMSCSEARNFITLDQANNDEHKYGFANYCSQDMFGADMVQQSALLMIPNQPDEGGFVRGEVRGSVSIRGTTADLYGSPSAIFPANMTSYLAETPIEVVLPQMGNFLIGAVYASSGVIVTLPDLIGYGESYDYERSYFSGYNMAQGVVLSWLGAKEFVTEKSNGCTLLEATASVTGYSEGGTAVINGALALEQIGVKIFAAYPGGAIYQPSLEFAYVFELFDSDTPPAGDGLLPWKIFLPMIGYASSINNNLLLNEMTGQNMLSEEFSRGDYRTNIYDWFNPPGQLTVGSAFIQFVPDNVIDVLNQELEAIYAESRALGEPDACSNFISNTTDALCASILAQDLIADLSDLVGFPTIVCHSDEDELVTVDQIPTFPFQANPLVTRFEGIPNVIPIMGSHGAASILCAVSPLSSLNSSGDSSPINILPIDECRTSPPTPSEPSAAPAPTPFPLSPSSTPTLAPTSSGYFSSKGSATTLFTTMMIAIAMSM